MPHALTLLPPATAELTPSITLVRNARADVIAAAERYLVELQATMPDITCDYFLVPANPADALASFASEEKCDLIVMSTHGRSGYKRGRYRRTADALLHRVKAPLLLIRGTDLDAP